MSTLHQDLTRTVLAVLFLGGLVGASLWLLAPFIPATIWAMTLVIATWPMMRHVQAALWNSRGLAVTVMTVAALLIFVAPFWFAVGTIAKNVEPIRNAAHYVADFKVPPTPDWIATLPVIGSSAAQAWDSVAAACSPRAYMIAAITTVSRNCRNRLPRPPAAPTKYSVALPA